MVTIVCFACPFSTISMNVMQASELEQLDPDLTIAGYKDNDRLNEAMVTHSAPLHRTFA